VNSSQTVPAADWHPQNWALLCQRLASGCLPHALLFRGQEGVGKKQSALAFAHYLLCQNRRSNGPCASCAGCRLVVAATHPDMLCVEPEKDGAEIKIAQVRELIAFTERTPLQGGSRVVILAPAESMNDNAANALLKCLEEPGSNTVLLLVCQHAGRLRATLRSRCQSVLFGVPPHALALDWLGGQGVEPDKAEPLLQLAGGGPIKALLYAQQAVWEQRESMLSGLVALGHGRKAPAQLAQEWSGFELKAVLEWMGCWVQEMVRYQATGNERFLVTSGYRKMFRHFAGRAGCRRLLALEHWLAEQRVLVASHSHLNAQLLLEAGLSRWLDLATTRLPVASGECD